MGCSSFVKYICCKKLNRLLTSKATRASSINVHYTVEAHGLTNVEIARESDYKSFASDDICDIYVIQIHLTYYSELIVVTYIQVHKSIWHHLKLVYTLTVNGL